MEESRTEKSNRTDSHLSQNDREHQINIMDLVTSVRRGKWIILVSFLFVMGGVSLYTLLVTPEYETFAIVKVNTKSASSFSSVLTFGTEDRGMNNELEFLKVSYPLALRVARRLIAMKTDTSGVPLPVLFNPSGDTLRAEQLAGVLMRKRVSFSLAGERVDLITITANSPLPSEASIIAQLYTEEYQTFSKELSRQSITASRKFLTEQREKRRSELDSLETRIAAFMAREGIVALETESTSLVQQLSQLDAQVDETRVDLKLAQASKSAMDAELERIEPGLAVRISSDVESRIEALQKSIAALDAEAEEYYASQPALRGNESEEPKLVRIINRRDSFQKELDLKAAQYTAEILAAGIVDSRVGGTGLNNVVSLKNDIVKKNIEIQGLKAKLQALEERLANREGRLEDLPRKSIQLAQLQRTSQSVEKLYDFLVEKLQEAQVAEESELGYVSIIRDALLPMKPVRPNTSQNVMLGILVSMVLGVGLAFLRQALDHRIHQPEDLINMGLSVIGVIPRFDRVIQRELGGKESVVINGREYNTSLISLYNPLSPITESYRAVHANIQFSRPDAVIQTILITSTEPNEGKSVTSVNLAISMARSGRKTLLIDGDLRAPGGHKLFGLPQEPGLSELLFEKTVDVDQYRTDIQNLSFLPAGKTSPNPSELMGSKKMRELMRVFKDNFDYIIIDSPPVLRATDAVLVSTQCDVTILVARADTTHRVAIERSIDALAYVGTKVIGVVLNRYDVSAAGYGYGYGYGYGFYGYSASGKGESKRGRIFGEALKKVLG